MRDFSWNVFAATGNIEAYLLYKECEGPDCECETDQENMEMKEQVEFN